VNCLHYAYKIDIVIRTRYRSRLLRMCTGHAELSNIWCWKIWGRWLQSLAAAKP